MLDTLVVCQPRWIGQPVSTLSIALPHPKFREIGRSIGMATKYGLDGSGLYSGRAKDTVLSKIIQTRSVAKLNLLFSGYWDSFPG